MLAFRELGEDYAAGLEDVSLRDAENRQLLAETSDFQPEPAEPVAFRMGRSIPNPFAPLTSLQYDVPFTSDVTIRVYDVAGRIVRTLVDGPVEAGRKVVEWDGTNDLGGAVASGVYFCVMEAGEYRGVRKVTLIR